MCNTYYYGYPGCFANLSCTLWSNVQNGDISTVKVLVAFGAKVDYINAKGMTAMDSASLNNQRAVVELLRRVGGHTEKEISKSKHAKKKIDFDEPDPEMDTRQSGNDITSNE